MFPTHYCIIDCLCAVVDQRTLLNLADLSVKWHRMVQPYIDSYGLSDEFSLNKQLELYCKNDNIIQLKKLIKCHKNQLDWTRGLMGASSAGNLQLISLFEILIDNRYSESVLECAFEELCQSNHDISTILKFKPISARKNVGLKGACIAGRMDLLQGLIKSYTTPMNKNDWNNAFQYACMGNNEELIDYCISNGANDWDKGLFGASAGGHLKLVEKMLFSGANDLESALYFACSKNQSKIAEYLCGFYPNCCNGLIGACQSGNLNLINLMIKYEAIEYNNINQMLNFYMKSVLCGNIEIVEYIYEQIKDFIIITYNQKFSMAVKSGNINMVNHFLKSNIENNVLNFCLELACNNNDYDIMKILIDMGAKKCNACDRNISEHRQNNYNMKLTYNALSSRLSNILKSCDKHFIEIILDIHPPEWKHLIYSFCKNGREDLIDLFINYNADLRSTEEYYEGLSEGLLGACKAENLYFVNKMLKLGAINLEFILSIACETGNLSIVKTIFNNDSLNLNEYDISAIFIAAGSSGNIELIQYIIDRGYENWSALFRGICMNKNQQLVEYILNLGVIPDIEDALESAVAGGCWFLNDYFIKRGIKELDLTLSKACYERNTKDIIKALEDGAKMCYECGCNLAKKQKHEIYLKLDTMTNEEIEEMFGENYFDEEFGPDNVPYKKKTSKKKTQTQKTTKLKAPTPKLKTQTLKKT